MGDRHRDSERSNAEAPAWFELDDAVRRALDGEQRRRVLHLLVDDDPRGRDELATALAGWAATDERSMTTAEDRERLRVELHHWTLPALDQADLASYDPATGEVALGDVDDAVLALLRGPDASRDRDR